MENRYGVCNNPNCDKCLAREVQEIEVGADFVCGECGRPLTEANKGKNKKNNNGRKDDKKLAPLLFLLGALIIIAVVVLLVVNNHKEPPKPPKPVHDTIDTIPIVDTSVVDTIRINKKLDKKETSKGGRAAEGEAEARTAVSTNAPIDVQLRSLVNHNWSSEGRLSLAESLGKNMFAPNAKVMTLSQNGSSIVDTEEAQQYLNRLALSSYIKDVIVTRVHRDANNMIENMVVQEVRY